MRSGSIHKHWPPVALLVFGAVLASDVRPQRSLDLRVPLPSAIPVSFAGLEGRDLSLSEPERTVTTLGLDLCGPDGVRGSDGRVRVWDVGDRPRAVEVRAVRLPGADVALAALRDQLRTCEGTTRTDGTSYRQLDSDPGSLVLTLTCTSTRCRSELVVVVAEST